MIGGVSYGELGFVAILVVVVVMAQIAPRIGEAIGARYEAKQRRDPPLPPPPAPRA